MKIFQCQHCNHPLFFEDTFCMGCGHALGYVHDFTTISVAYKRGNVLEAHVNPGMHYRYCNNHQYGVCNWLIPVHSSQSLCLACELNSTIPNLNNATYFKSWQKLERAKHHLIYSLLRFKLPVQGKSAQNSYGLAFEFLSDEPSYSRTKKFNTGHLNGLITINIAEADSVHREAIRTQMSEPYRTLIGHFRHEIGHYYWDKLVFTDYHTLCGFRELFGDERIDYSQALENHYRMGAPTYWQNNFISSYATSHPWEDWAETWAHYMHLVDTLETAHVFGVSVKPLIDNDGSLSAQAHVDPYTQVDFEYILATCLPLICAVNHFNRGMGQPDLYPFITPPMVKKKLRFIHDLIRKNTQYLPAV